MKKRLLTIMLAVVIALAIFVVADYFGVFGIEEHAMTDFVEIRVKTIDAETGRVIPDVKVTCFQFNTQHACGQPPSRERGVVRIHLLVEKHVRESLLFTHGVRYTPVLEKELRIMYIHGDYEKPVKRYNIPELIKSGKRSFRVEMTPLTPSAERNRQRQTRQEAGS